MQATDAVTVDGLDVSAYTIPTEQPEADGTLEWDSTTMVLVEAHGGGKTGIGYSYTHKAAAEVVTGKLAGVVSGMDVMAVGAAWAAMWQAVRNFGQTGVVSMAISAVDIALWDLKARVLDKPLIDVIDAVHDSTPIYGSGGFCNYTDRKLGEQLSGWVEAGIPRVKMKVGRDSRRDHERLAAARRAVGDDVELYVDANGAHTRSEAARWAALYAEHDVRWYEEPVSSDDLEGLHLVRAKAPGGVEVAAGEYGWNLPYFQRMLDAGAVDCLQADVTRCGGITGLRRVGALCDARSIDLSAHCAPQVSAQACTALWHLRHLEYFHDHNRIEHLVFDGCLEPAPGGVLKPDASRPGMGLTVKRDDIEKWRVS
ncbi:MAG TPA: enolase C-terminal domain-like protein [Acidothermaceae bacterium]|nr:enolase C-terminal domain-like protein [Acidothermaceae bacterium]